jgi:hypothetical protein
MLKETVAAYFKILQIFSLIARTFSGEISLESLLALRFSMKNAVFWDVTPRGAC